MAEQPLSRSRSPSALGTTAAILVVAMVASVACCRGGGSTSSAGSEAVTTSAAPATTSSEAGTGVLERHRDRYGFEPGGLRGYRRDLWSGRWPVDDDHTRFRVRRAPRDALRELDADEEIWPGLSAAEICQLNSYRAIPPVDELDVVLVVGSEDQYPDTNAAITAALADALETSGVGLEVVIVEGADHDNIVDPTTDHGQATIEVIADILANIG